MLLWRLIHSSMLYAPLGVEICVGLEQVLVRGNNTVKDRAG